jgi:hypothetical protein
MAENSMPSASVHYPNQLVTGEIRLLRVCAEKSVVDYQGMKLASFTLERVRLPKQTISGSPKSSTTTEACLSPFFTALSYVWGSEENKLRILVNGAVFEITQNLFVAIHGLRTEILKQPIWIDAICINQGDSVEKGYQLNQMTEVYRQARKVIVWLGPGDEESNLALKRGYTIGRKFLKCEIQPSNPSQEALEHEPQHQLEEIYNLENASHALESLISEVADMATSKDPAKHFPARAFVTLTYRNWFERAWVLQEVTVAEGYTVVACGDIEMPFDVFAAAVKLVSLWLTSELRKLEPFTTITEEPNHVSKFLDNIGLTKFVIDPLYSALKSIGEIGTPTHKIDPLLSINPQASMTLGTRWKYWKLRQQGEKMSLMSLLTRSYTLETTEGLKCRDGRDRIYALAGISGDMSFLGSPSNFYGPSRHEHDVYIDTSRYLIGLGHIDTLSLCRVQDPVLPSWVPDWSKRIRQPWSLYREDGLFRTSGKDPLSTPTVPTMKSVASSNILSLRVFRVDSLMTTGVEKFDFKWKAGLDDSFDFESAGRVLDIVKHFLSLSNREYNDDAIWRIPIGDKETNEWGQFGRASSTFEEASQQMINEIQSNNPGKGYRGPAFAAYQNMMLSMHGSTPFISFNGYVGLCPDNAEPNDVIYVPDGAHVPYIFRRVANGMNYRLIGEAYVHGIMDGEYTAGNPPNQTIQIE